MFAKPQKEHLWLHQFVGDWQFEHDCEMPDGTRHKATGHIHCRTLNGLWLVCESQGGEGENAWTSIMTVGFDPTTEKYRGTFVGSMMTHLWPYEGVLDSSGTKLPLYSHGPKFDGTGTCAYCDTLEVVDGDTWLMNSKLQADDGSWQGFMNARHTRR